MYGGYCYVASSSSNVLSIVLDVLLVFLEDE